MNTYEIHCVRRAGSSSPVRAVTFQIDADTAEQAEDIADARMARMRSFPGQNELDIDSTTELGPRP